MGETVSPKPSIELLAPAGGPEQFNAALAAGADALYCGFGHHFNARRGATSFDDQSFADACRRAHLAGARVYVTVNVVVKADEMVRALALARHVWLLGADALIIQDWGLLSEIRRRWPQMEVHVSTQANVHDARGVAWCRDMWHVPRVTLSRELSVGEIARIAQEGVVLEGFGHGALCFSYSGICMLSAMGGNRSANRGACAQPCRLPYELIDEQGRTWAPANVRPLCPRDYCTIERLDELVGAGLASLKLEGRLKGADYVHAVVRAYRAALDELTGLEPELSSDERARLLKRAFNRDFTDAYLDGRSGNEMMSYERSNNRGELVGEVVATRNLGSARVFRGGSNGGRERTRKVTRAEVDIRLDAPVGKGDLLEVRPLDDPAQFLTTNASADAQAGETICCRTARPMEVGSPVRVIRSQQALDAAARVAHSDVPRLREVRVRVVARLGEPFMVELASADGVAQARATGFVVEPARSRSVSEQDLIEHVGRMGGSAFKAISFSIELDEGCGMRFSDVHKVRSDACRLLMKALLQPYEAREAQEVPSEVRFARDVRERLAQAALPLEQQAVEVCALVTSAAQLRKAREAGATRLYATADTLAELSDNERENVIPWLDEVCREGDHQRLDHWVQTGEAVAVGNVSQLARAAEREAYAEVRPCIPVHNPSALAALVEAGARGVWLSPELSLDEVRSLAAASTVPVGLVVYGRTRAMTTEHCVLQVSGRCVHDCARCGMRQRQLSLRSVQGDVYPVRTDLQGRSRIYGPQPLDAAPEVAELLGGGVRRLLVDGTLLEPSELAAAVARVARAVRAAEQGEPSPKRLAGHTSGHLHRPIE